MSDILGASHSLCEGLSTDTLLTLLHTVDNSVAFAVIADVICRRWMIDGRPLAEATDPVAALWDALSAAGYDGTVARPL